MIDTRGVSENDGKRKDTGFCEKFQGLAGILRAEEAAFHRK